MRSSSVSRCIARILCGCCVVFAIAITPVFAQMGANTGLTGRVADPTGASIPGATVTLTRVETGERRTAKTDSAGNWEVRFLSPGIYRLLFESQGFKKLAREGVVVTTAEVVVANVHLRGDQSHFEIAAQGQVSGWLAPDPIRGQRDQLRQNRGPGG